MLKNRIGLWVGQTAVYFGVSLALFGFFVLSYPSASIHAEPFAETALRYFAEFQGASPLGYLFAKDFGYYGLVPRALYLVLGTKYGSSAFPEVAQTLTLFVMALSISLFVLDKFSPVIESRWLRLLTVILLASGHEYGMFLLHNLGYCFVFPVCYGLALFMTASKDKYFVVGLSVIMTAFLWSKGYSLAAVPALLFGVFDRVRRRDFFMAASFALVLVASAPQFLAVFEARGAFGSKSGSPMAMLQNIFYFYIYAWRHFTIGGEGGRDSAYAEFFGSLVALCFIWASVFRMKGRNADYQRSAFIGSQVLALGGIGLVVGAMIHEKENLFRVPGFEQDTYFFCTQVSICFGASILIGRYLTAIPRTSLKVLAAVAVLWLSGTVSFVRSHIGGQKDPYGDTKNSASSWYLYQRLVANGELHCFPVNPPGSFYPSGCEEPVAGKVTEAASSGSIVLKEGVRDGIRAVCIRDLKEGFSKVEIRAHDRIFESQSFREPGNLHPCFKWPQEVKASAGVTVTFPVLTGSTWKPNPGKIVLLY